MRNIKTIVIHCTGTRKNAKVKDIQDYWHNVKGWQNPGYHKMILPDGKVEVLQIDGLPTNGVKGHNANSLHVAYIGGLDEQDRHTDTRTEAQKYALMKVVREWIKKYPDAELKGHRDFEGVSKSCPNFKVTKKEFIL